MSENLIGVATDKKIPIAFQLSAGEEQKRLINRKVAIRKEGCGNCKIILVTMFYQVIADVVDIVMWHWFTDSDDNRRFTVVEVIVLEVNDAAANWVHGCCKASCVVLVLSPPHADGARARYRSKFTLQTRGEDTLDPEKGKGRFSWPIERSFGDDDRLK